jgi:HEAT repeat protein
VTSNEARTTARNRRVEISLAGVAGDLGAVRAGLEDADPAVRSAALSALARRGELSSADVARAIADPSPKIRQRICELATTVPRGAFDTLLDDAEPEVVEAAAFACGEQELAEAVEALARVTTSHPDALCRESAVAALGVLGLAAGLSAVLVATGDVAAVRRRAVIALANYDGPEVDGALTRALADRDWQVRQAAEDVIGINRTSTH